MTPEETLRQALLEDKFPESDEKPIVPIADPLKYNRMTAVSAWMGNLTGQDISPEDIGWQAEKDALAQEFFKMPDAKDVTDETVHDLIRSHIQTSDNAKSIALDSALSGRSFSQTLNEVQAFTGVSKTRGIRDRYVNEASNLYGNVAARVAPYRAMINNVAGTLSKEMEFALPTTDAFQKAADALLLIPIEDRALVINAIGKTGGATAEERASYLSKLSGAMGRMSEQMGSSVESAMSEAALTETVAQLQEAGQMGFAKKMEAETDRQDEFRLLTQMVRDVANSEISPIKGDGVFSQLGIDLARMIPQSAVSVASPAMGFAANVAYFDATQTAQAMMEDPRLSLKQARASVALSAPISAAAETITALIPFGKVKLPFFSKWIQATTTSTGAALRNLGVRAATGTAGEITEEYVQSAAPLISQELLGVLSADMPDVDWENRMPDFSKVAAETWAPALVFSLIGAGATSISDIKNGRSLAADLDMMVASGVNPELAGKIKAESEAGNWSQVDSLFREEFVSKSKATAPDIQAATERLKARFRDQSSIDVLQDATSPEYTAKVIRTPTGWQVQTGDGNVVTTETKEAADQIYSKIRQVGNQKEAEVITEILEYFYSSGMGRGAQVEMTGETVGAAGDVVSAIRRDAGGAPIAGSARVFDEKALEEVRAEAAAAGFASDTQEVFARINGSNEVFPQQVGDTAKGIWRILSLFESRKNATPQVATLLHEDIESKFTLGLINKSWTVGDIQKAFAGLLPAFANITAPIVQTDEQIAKMSKSAQEAYYAKQSEFNWINNVRNIVDGKFDAATLRETFSEMYVRDRFALDRKGLPTGLPAGSISRGIEASIMGATTQEEAGIYKRFRAMFKAFSAHFKAVFKTVQTMVAARKEGKIGEDWDSFVNKVLGIDEVRQMESQAIDEGMAMLGIDEETQAVIDAGNMAFSTSRAQPADTSNEPSPGGLSEAGVRLNLFHGNTPSFGRFARTPLGIHLGSEDAARDRIEQTGQNNAVITEYSVELNNPVSLRYDPGTWMVNEVFEALPQDVKKQVEESFPYDISDLDYEDLKNELQGLGFDGIKYPNAFEGRRSKSYLVFEENQIHNIEVNPDPVTYDDAGNVIPLSQRFNEATSDIRFSISPVNRVSKSEFNEKLEELQTLDLEDDQFTMPKFNAAKDKLVDTFADEAHLMVRGKNAISPFGAHELFIVDNDDKPIGFVRLTKSPEQISINMIYIDEDYRGRGIGSDFYRYWLDKGVSIKSDKEITDGTAAIYQKLASEGYGMDIQDDRAVLLPRLNETTSKVSFSISPVRNLNELSDQVEKQFAENPVGALEVKSRVIRQFAKLADKWSNERWTPQGDKIRPISEKRTVKSLDKEQAMRQAQREVELTYEGMDRLTPETLMAYSEGVGTLQDDPLIARMLNDNGKLMSKATAEREGRGIKDQYDDAGWIPPQWYAKSGGIMPDVMANNLGFDYASEMWAALESSIKSHRTAKAGYAKAEDAVKAVERAAFEQARKEAQAWRTETDAMQKEDWSPRESLVRDLITLEAIIAMFPQEIRGKIGGFVALARKASEAARLKVLQKQLERGQVLLEKHLKEQYGEATEKLFDKYRPERKAGEKPKGKLDPDAQEIADKSESAMRLNADQVNAEIASINTMLDANNISAEDEAKLEAMRELVQLLGDWKNADSARRESAFIALNDVLTEGWAKWKMKQILKREQREEMRKLLKSATGKKGVAIERDKMKIEAAKVLGKASRWMLNLSSFGEVMTAVFGAKVSRQFIDNERNASNQYEDAIQDFSERIDEFFTTLTGGVLKGERLRFDLAQPSLTIGAGGMNERNISQLQGIQALLMWQQEDGRRHMEGPRDENGAAIDGKWSYDQAWIDELTGKLTPEAVEVKKFIEQLYSEEWVPLNAVYRERHGVNLPRHDKYAPITVTPQQAKLGEMVDPVSGAAIAGSILTPGSLRSRNRSALAEPDFRDALSTFIAHTKQMEHWKAYYDIAIEMQAVLGNRDVANSVKAAVGDEGVTVLKKWVDVFAQGGTRDAAAGLAVSDGLGRLSGRVATVGLLGRFSTLLVQSTQLAAAAVRMPTGAYLKRFALLMSGNLQWIDAINSEFIQRRIKSAPPLIRQAMQNIGEATRPNQIQRVTRHLGQLLSGADGLFTAGTYAILLDYHRTMGARMGMEGDALETYAHSEAVNATEQVAQPVRTGARSIIEVTNTNPLAKMSWAYASEARQKVALFAWSAYNAKNDPTGAAKTAFLVFVVGGLMSQVLKNLWREAKGDDDEKKWSPERLTMAALSPITSAIPGAGMIAGEGGSLSGAQYAKQSIKDIFDGKADMKDVDTVLSVMGYFNDTAGGIATLSHAGYDFAQVLENAFGEE